jgi:hypothetical protein
MDFYRQGRKERDFETGIERALAGVLVSPGFILRTEEEPANVADGAVYRVNDLALGLARIVLPLEQHSRRRTSGCRDQRPAS